MNIEEHMVRLRVPVAIIVLLFVGPRPTRARVGLQDRASTDLRERVEATPVLPFVPATLSVTPPNPAWKSGTVSSVAVDRAGHLYELQRGDQAAPILMLDRSGTLLRSFGAGDFKLPHSIRIDPSGNVWAVDANASTVIEYSPLGRKLLTIVVGGQPNIDSPFNGTTDIAFAPNGNLYITDGYGNARILEYATNGTLLKHWGRPGSGPGEFHLPHSIQIDPSGVIYVADRENGRIQKFDLAGNVTGEIGHLGRVFSIELAQGILWATIQPFDQPVTSGGWLIKLDPQTGSILGHIAIPQLSGHAVTTLPSGEPVVTQGSHVLIFGHSGPRGPQTP